MKTLLFTAVVLVIGASSCSKKADLPEPLNASTQQLQAGQDAASHSKIGPVQQTERYPSKAKSMSREYRPF